MKTERLSASCQHKRRYFSCTACKPSISGLKTVNSNAFDEGPSLEMSKFSLYFTGRCIPTNPRLYKLNYLVCTYLFICFIIQIFCEAIRGCTTGVICRAAFQEEPPSRSPTADESFPTHSGKDFPTHSGKDFPTHSGKDFLTHSGKDFPKHSGKDFPTHSETRSGTPPPCDKGLVRKCIDYFKTSTFSVTSFHMTRFRCHLHV